MSKCISGAGEYSQHITNDEYSCDRCFAFDEDAALAEINRLMPFVRSLASHGISFDLNPTVDLTAGATPYLNYLKRIDQSIRQRAALALSPDIRPEES